MGKNQEWLFYALPVSCHTLIHYVNHTIRATDLLHPTGHPASRSFDNLWQKVNHGASSQGRCQDVHKGIVHASNTQRLSVKRNISGWCPEVRHSLLQIPCLVDSEAAAHDIPSNSAISRLVILQDGHGRWLHTSTLRPDDCRRNLVGKSHAEASLRDILGHLTFYFLCFPSPRPTLLTKNLEFGEK